MTKRLVDALIRIGDLEMEISNHKELSRGAYELAIDLSPDKTRPLARIGYHYLVLGYVAKLKAEAGENDQISVANEYFKEAQKYFAEADQCLDQFFYEYNGIDHGRDTLAWLYSNYAHVLTLTLPGSKDPSRAQAVWRIRGALYRALYYGNPASRARIDPMTNGGSGDKLDKDFKRLFAENRDLRVAGATLYIGSQDISELQLGWSALKPCPQIVGPGLEDNPVCHLEDLLKQTDQYTVNNTILLEWQLKEFYRYLCRDDSAGSEKEKEACLNKASLHQRSLYLVAALREYRAGAFDDSRRLIERGGRQSSKQNPEPGNLSKLDEAFIVSTWQVHDPDKGEAYRDSAENALASITGKDGEWGKLTPKDEVFWRALSLKAARRVMCLDSPEGGPCSVTNISDLENAASAASQEMPGNAYLHANLGLVLFRGKHVNESLREFKQAVEINQWDPWLRCLLAEAYAEKGDTEEAESEQRFGQLLDPARWAYYYSDVHAVWPKIASVN